MTFYDYEKISFIFLHIKVAYWVMLNVFLILLPLVNLPSEWCWRSFWSFFNDVQGHFNGSEYENWLFNDVTRPFWTFFVWSVRIKWFWKLMILHSCSEFDYQMMWMVFFNILLVMFLLLNDFEDCLILLPLLNFSTQIVWSCFFC